VSSWSSNPGPPGAGCEGCPRAVAPRGALRPYAAPYPVGVVRRVAALEPPISQDDEKAKVDEARRTVLKLAVVAGAVAAMGGGGAMATHYLLSPPAAASYPRVQLLYSDASPVLVSSYPYGPSNTELILFNYPLDNEPNMLLNLAAAAPNGVGPNGSLVAFSAVCEHQGYQPPYISYYPPGSCLGFNGGNAFIHCTGHGSTYDPGVQASGGGAALITGPASLPLPQVILEWDSVTDYLYAIGMVGAPVFGHPGTLKGGSPVTSPVALAAPLTPEQQCP